MNAFLNSFLDFLLPRFCCQCGNNLALQENLFCSECNSKITRVSTERLNREFERKFKNDCIISGLQSLFVFEEKGAIQKIIHEMKYKNTFLIGKIAGELVGSELLRTVTDWNAGLIIPVPIHRLRRAERGYNQSLYIARGIGKATGIPVKPGIIKRGRYTSTQTKLNLSERKINVQDAFVLKQPEVVNGKRIILVDDVITTGATISECGKMLLDNGAEKIFAMSIALAE